LRHRSRGWAASRHWRARSALPYRQRSPLVSPPEGRLSAIGVALPTTMASEATATHSDRAKCHTPPATARERPFELPIAPTGRGRRPRCQLCGWQFDGLTGSRGSRAVGHLSAANDRSPSLCRPWTLDQASSPVLRGAWVRTRDPAASDLRQEIQESGRGHDGAGELAREAEQVLVARH
jgi:hypothetical protein